MHKHLGNAMQVFPGCEVTETWCWEIQAYSQSSTVHSKAAEPKQVNSANLNWPSKEPDGSLCIYYAFNPQSRYTARGLDL